jgi:hypothetical protein
VLPPILPSFLLSLRPQQRMMPENDAAVKTQDEANLNLCVFGPNTAAKHSSTTLSLFPQFLS